MHRQLHADYFEAKIQIRPYNEEIIQFIDNQVKKNKGVFISKIVRIKEGIDFYVSSNKFARKIGKKLKESFKGELKESKKLFSKDRLTSKTLYRVTICFKLKNDE